MVKPGRHSSGSMLLLTSVGAEPNQKGRTLEVLRNLNKIHQYLTSPVFRVWREFESLAPLNIILGIYLYLHNAKFLLKT